MICENTKDLCPGDKKIVVDWLNAVKVQQGGVFVIIKKKNYNDLLARISEYQKTIIELQNKISDIENQNKAAGLLIAKYQTKEELTKNMLNDKVARLYEKDNYIKILSDVVSAYKDMIVLDTDEEMLS